MRIDFHIECGEMENSNYIVNKKVTIKEIIAKKNLRLDVSFPPIKSLVWEGCET